MSWIKNFTSRKLAVVVDFFTLYKSKMRLNEIQGNYWDTDKGMLQAAAWQYDNESEPYGALWRILTNKCRHGLNAQKMLIKSGSDRNQRVPLALYDKTLHW